MVVSVPCRRRLGACCGGRVDRRAAGTQPDWLDPRSGRAVACGCARGESVRVGRARSASGVASRRLVGRSGFLVVARLLRLATGCHVLVSGRPPSVAAVAPVRALRGERDDAPHGGAGACRRARTAVRGCGESGVGSVSGRPRVPATRGLAVRLRQPDRRRCRGPGSLPAVQRDRAAADALARICGAPDPVGGRLVPRLVPRGQRGRRWRGRGRGLARNGGCRRDRCRRGRDAIPVVRDRSTHQPDGGLRRRHCVARPGVRARFAPRRCRGRAGLNLGDGPRGPRRRGCLRAAAEPGSGCGGLALRPRALRGVATRARIR